MPRSLPEKLMFWVLIAIVGFPLAKHLIPISLPFLLGLGLAMAAEPAVVWLHRQLKLGRGLAAGFGVTGVFILSAAVLTVLLSLLLRQLGHLADLLPDVTEAISQGATLLKQWLLSLAQKVPSGVRQVVIGVVESLFEDSSGLLRQAAGKIPQIAGNALGHLSHGLVGIITILLSAYMISARLPQLRQQIPPQWTDRFLPAAKGFRKALGHWLLAQGKLAGITLILLSVGFMVLKIPNALLWAVLVTMVDILPILGVGTVLVPWSLVSFLQGDAPKAVGLLGIFLVAWLVRSVLEPKLVGKELGLDPLITLLCIYAGFRLWGIAGMLLAPLAAICVLQLWRQRRDMGRKMGPYDAS